VFGKKKLVASASGIKIIPKAKRESFSPSDKAWLKSQKEIQLGERLGEGIAGEVFTIAGNDKLVIKVPRGYRKNNKFNQPEREYLVKHTQDDILIEASFYNKHKLHNEDLFIPSKIVKLPKRQSLGNRKVFGIVRPRIEQLTEGGSGRVSDSIKKKLTRAVMEDIRKKVIQLSHKGYIFYDGLQLGITSQGKPYLYDLGAISKREDEMRAFATNEAMWEAFLVNVGKAKSFKYSDLDEAIAKYGDINEFDY